MAIDYQTIEEELSKTNLAKTKEEIYFLEFLISKDEHKDDVEILIDSIYTKNLYMKSIDCIFSNKDFISSIDRILKEKNSIEDKLFVFSGLHLIGFLFSLVFEKLTKENIIFLRKVLSIVISRTAKELKTENLPYLLEKILREEKPHCKYPFKINEEFYYKNSKNACSIIGITLLIIPRLGMLKKSLKLKGTDGKVAIFGMINSIYSNIYKIKRSLDYYSKNEVDLNYLIENIVHKNEKNTFFIIEKVVENLNHVTGRTFHQTIIEKIKRAEEDIKIIDDYASKNFSAFLEDSARDDSEWSNKIYLISKKTLTIFESINGAKNQNWKVKVAMYELDNWIDEVHKIINKFEIADDWEIIKEYIDQENNKIEWKSSFFTPTEQLFINTEKEKVIEKNLMNGTAEAILSMINTDGGNIIIGLVENPDKIKRENIKKNTIIKKGVTFFNVDYEFVLKSKSIDHTKRELLDILYNKTGYSSEKFNQLFSIKKIIIKDDLDRVANIYLVDVKKANNLIFSQEKRGEGTWISILKRANGKTVNVDPRDYFVISS